MSSNPCLVLASASPRRLCLLRQIGIVPDRVVAPDVDESVRPGERPRELAARLAEAKARAVAEAIGLDGDDALVLGADTAVACGRRLLPKAVDADAARRCLRLLSGRRHRVYGGISVVGPGGSARTRLVETVVAFKRLGAPEVERYLASGEWRGKAGGYAVQGLAAAFVARINGSYTNVVGLPVFETAALLEGLGYRPRWGE